MLLQSEFDFKLRTDLARCMRYFEAFKEGIGKEHHQEWAKEGLETIKEILEYNSQFKVKV